MIFLLLPFVGVAYNLSLKFTLNIHRQFRRSMANGDHDKGGHEHPPPSRFFEGNILKPSSMTIDALPDLYFVPPVLIGT